MANFCKHCGRAINPTSRFCKNCGREIPKKIVSEGTPENAAKEGDTNTITKNKENIDKITDNGNGIIDLDFRAFEVKTIRIIRS